MRVDRDELELNAVDLCRCLLSMLYSELWKQLWSYGAVKVSTSGHIITEV